MAVRIEQGELDHLLDQHNTFLTTGGESGGRLSLHRSNLSGLSFRSAWVTDAQFAECILTNCDLTGTRLDDAFLVASDLSGSQLSNTSLRRADLAEVVAPATLFAGVDLLRTDLSRAHLAGSRFEHAALTRTVFHQADLRGVQMMDLTLDQVAFDGALLGNNTFERVVGTVMDYPAVIETAAGSTQATGTDVVAYLNAHGARVELCELAR